MSAKYAGLRAQIKVAMMQLGHEPSSFKGNGRTEVMIVRCKRCGVEAQVDTDGTPTGDAIDMSKSCNAATPILLPSPKVQQAKENEELFKHLRQLH